MEGSLIGITADKNGGVEDWASDFEFADDAPLVKKIFAEDTNRKNLPVVNKKMRRSTSRRRGVSARPKKSSPELPLSASKSAGVTETPDAGKESTSNSKETETDLDEDWDIEFGFDKDISSSASMHSSLNSIFSQSPVDKKESSLSFFLDPILNSWMPSMVVLPQPSSFATVKEMFHAQQFEQWLTRIIQKHLESSPAFNLFAKYTGNTEVPFTAVKNEFLSAIASEVKFSTKWFTAYAVMFDFFIIVFRKFAHNAPVERTDAFFKMPRRADRGAANVKQPWYVGQKELWGFFDQYFNEMKWLHEHHSTVSGREGVVSLHEAAVYSREILIHIAPVWTVKQKSKFDHYCDIAQALFGNKMSLLEVLKNEIYDEVLQRSDETEMDMWEEEDFDPDPLSGVYEIYANYLKKELSRHTFDDGAFQNDVQKLKHAVKRGDHVDTDNIVAIAHCVADIHMMCALLTPLFFHTDKRSLATLLVAEQVDQSCWSDGLGSFKYWASGAAEADFDDPGLASSADRLALIRELYPLLPPSVSKVRCAFILSISMLNTQENELAEGYMADALYLLDTIDRMYPQILTELGHAVICHFAGILLHNKKYIYAARCLEASILHMNFFHKKDYFLFLRSAAEIAKNHDDIERSITLYDEGCKKYVIQHKYNEASFVMGSLADLHMATGNFTKAESVLLQALDMCSEQAAAHLKKQGTNEVDQELLAAEPFVFELYEKLADVLILGFGFNRGLELLETLSKLKNVPKAQRERLLFSFCQAAIHKGWFREASTCLRELRAENVYCLDSEPSSVRTSMSSASVRSCSETSGSTSPRSRSNSILSSPSLNVLQPMHTTAFCNESTLTYINHVIRMYFKLKKYQHALYAVDFALGVTPEAKMYPRGRLFFRRAQILAELNKQTYFHRFPTSLTLPVSELANITSISYAPKEMFFDRPTDIFQECAASYRKAYSYFNSVGDDVHMAKSLCYLAKFYAEYCFVPIVWEGKEFSEISTFPLYNTVTWQRQSFTERGVFELSLEMLEDPAVAALSMASEIYDVLLLPDCLLNLCEVRWFQGNKDASLSYWMQCRNLFWSLYMDGPHMIVRTWAEYVTNRLIPILERMTRMLFCFGADVINANLVVIDACILAQTGFIQLRSGSICTTPSGQDDSPNPKQKVTRTDSKGKSSHSLVPQKIPGLTVYPKKSGGPQGVPDENDISFMYEHITVSEDLWGVAWCMRSQLKKYLNGNISKSELINRNKGFIRTIITEIADKARNKRNSDDLKRTVSIRDMTMQNMSMEMGMRDVYDSTTTSVYVVHLGSSIFYYTPKSGSMFITNLCPPNPPALSRSRTPIAEKRQQIKGLNSHNPHTKHKRQSSLSGSETSHKGKLTKLNLREIEVKTVSTEMVHPKSVYMDVKIILTNSPEEYIAYNLTPYAKITDIFHDIISKAFNDPPELQGPAELKVTEMSDNFLESVLSCEPDRKEIEKCWSFSTKSGAQSKPLNIKTVIHSITPRAVSEGNLTSHMRTRSTSLEYLANTTDTFKLGTFPLETPVVTLYMTFGKLGRSHSAMTMLANDVCITKQSNYFRVPESLSFVSLNFVCGLACDTDLAEEPAQGSPLSPLPSTPQSDSTEKRRSSFEEARKFKEFIDTLDDTQLKAIFGKISHVLPARASEEPMQNLTPRSLSHITRSRERLTMGCKRVKPPIALIISPSMQVVPWEMIISHDSPVVRYQSLYNLTHTISVSQLSARNTPSFVLPYSQNYDEAHEECERARREYIRAEFTRNMWATNVEPDLSRQNTSTQLMQTPFAEFSRSKKTVTLKKVNQVSFFDLSQMETCPASICRFIDQLPAQNYPVFILSTSDICPLPEFLTTLLQKKPGCCIFAVPRVGMKVFMEKLSHTHEALVKLQQKKPGKTKEPSHPDLKDRYQFIMNLVNNIHLSTKVPITVINAPPPSF